MANDDVLFGNLVLSKSWYAKRTLLFAHSNSFIVVSNCFDRPLFTFYGSSALSFNRSWSWIFIHLGILEFHWYTTVNYKVMGDKMAIFEIQRWPKLPCFINFNGLELSSLKQHAVPWVLQQYNGRRKSKFNLNSSCAIKTKRRE